MLLGGLLLLQGRAIGSWVLILGLLTNLVGWRLWRRRDALAPYPALQLLLATAGVAAGFAMVGVSIADVHPTSLQLPRDVWFLLVYPSLMLVFHGQERAARRASG